MNDTTLFKFEGDFIRDLRCIPMAVRFKLDAVGVKLSLREWSRMSVDARGVILRAACSSEPEAAAYKDSLRRFVFEATGEALRPLSGAGLVPWVSVGKTPEAIVAFADSKGFPSPTAEEWHRLRPLQRFALLKLTREGHENENFAAALREFGLVGRDNQGGPEAIDCAPSPEPGDIGIRA